MFDPATRVLIVDDNFAMRKLISGVIRKAGIGDITETSDCDKAWRAVLDAKPLFNFVIVDSILHACNGFDFIRRLRNDSRFKLIPCILTELENEDLQVSDFAKVSPTLILPKPFSSEDLKDKIEMLSKGRTK